MVREAASNGANLILLPELFERPYFCQEKRYDYYDYALPLTENPAIRRFQAVAGELGVVIPVSFYERDVQRLFNSIAMIDADGSILGVYRKTHIPDDHFYQEKFYFTPGDTGFKVFETRFGTIGIDHGNGIKQALNIPFIKADRNHDPKFSGNGLKTPDGGIFCQRQGKS